MKFVVAFACWAGLLFGSAAAAPPAFKSLSYEVIIVPDFAAGTITGAEHFRFQSLSDDMDTLSFTANALTVNAALDSPADITISTEAGRRIFHLPRRLAKGETATLSMSFSGQPKRDIAFTANEIHTGYFTCEIMICDIDRPADRATLQLSLRLPSGMDAVGPGELVWRTEIGRNDISRNSGE